MIEHFKGCVDLVVEAVIKFVIVRSINLFALTATHIAVVDAPTSINLYFVLSYRRLSRESTWLRVL